MRHPLHRPQPGRQSERRVLRASQWGFAARGLRAAPARPFRVVHVAVSLLLALLGGIGATPGQSATPSEYCLKAGFLYNFAQFVQWPEPAFGTNAEVLTIGIVGEDPFGALLDEMVKGEQINRRNLVIRRFGPGEEPAGCQILFISLSERDRIPALLGSLDGRPMLTVSEADSFIPNGGMIRLFAEQGKIRFEINPRAAERGGLKISSKLLHLARNNQGGSGKATP